MAILSWCLGMVPALGLMAGLASLPMQEDAMFPDVPKDHWAYEAVADLKRKGILVGYPPEPKAAAKKPGAAAKPAKKSGVKTPKTGRES